MVQTDSDYAIGREKLDPCVVIGLIKETSGLSILAHLFMINHTSIPREAYNSRLIDGGLDGIEAANNYSKTNYHGEWKKGMVTRERAVMQG